MFHIQTFNNIAEVGLKEFSTDQYQVTEKIANPDAIILRSHNLHDTKIPESTKIIGRAGAGTNNIPVDKMTELGIPVLNTPGANANAVKELVITGMLLACRNICRAWDYARQIEGDDEAMHQQVEQNKKRFAGFELPGKTLGIVGLGNIGVKVANAAIHLGMRVIGYDPAITVKSAWKLSSNVEQAEYLNDVFEHSDFISLHCPLNEKTHHLVNDQRLAKMKKGVVILNFAREGIIDLQALGDAINKQHVASYVCDFPAAIFKDNPQVISLPHLGASTKEAEENCAVMVVEQVKDYLENGHIRNAVNFPPVKMPRNAETFRLAVVNRNIPNMVAQITSVLSDSKCNIIDMINKSQDKIAYTLFDVDKAISDATLAKIADVEGVIRLRRM